jgi:hypothetical protein
VRRNLTSGLIFVSERCTWMPRPLPGGRKRQAVFAVVHRDPGAAVFWHLADEVAGRCLARGFEVLARSGGYTAPQ